MAASGLVQRSELVASGAGVFWLESDPASGGTVIVTIGPEGVVPVLPEPFSVRSQVNNYGGGALCAAARHLFAVEASGQQVYRIDPVTATAIPLTNDPDACFGGLAGDAGNHRLLAVREADGRQQLVAITASGNTAKCHVLHGSEDFYSAPAISADGRRIAWVSWSLPDMPWVASVLWTASVREDGSLTVVKPRPTPARGSVQQPVFDGDAIVILSDHQGWWQPWRLSADGDWCQLDDAPLDHASAPWQLGERHHQPLPDGGWIRVRYRSGVGELWLCRQNKATPGRIATEYADFRCLAVVGQRLFCIARSATRTDVVLSVDCASGQVERLAGGEEPFPGMALSRPEMFTVPPSEGVGEEVSGFWYPPVRGAAGSNKPPLILIAHGGPTSTAYPVLNLQTQFWCHQGFAVAEVNYRGSSGFGRAFRMELKGAWGNMDVTDMERAALWLAGKKHVDRSRLYIQGRSSGGYTVLMAMVRGEVFSAGASQFGVSDPERLRTMTHRFESGYLDWLLGAYDEYPETWRQRSPLVQAGRVRRPMIFFQGQQDRVVVPEQTASIVKALRGNGGAPEVYVYPDEGHGFRKQNNLADMLERLLRFYQNQAS